MRAVIQRVASASVTIDGEKTAEIGKGLLVFVGIGQEDTKQDIEYIVSKTTNLRIFEDADEKMNLSVSDINGEILIVSQFTLMGDARKGRRPGFSGAMSPEQAKSIYAQAVEEFSHTGIKTKSGIFQADMKVGLVNDGPVTILLDSKKLF